MKLEIGEKMRNYEERQRRETEMDFEEREPRPPMPPHERLEHRPRAPPPPPRPEGITHEDLAEMIDAKFDSLYKELEEIKRRI